MQATRLIILLTLISLVLAVGYPAAPVLAGPPSYEAGEVLVKYRANRAVQRQLHYRSMWRLTHARTFVRSGIRKIRLPADMTVGEAVALYRSDPDVIFAEPNYRYRLQAVPNDTDLARLWGLINTGQIVNHAAGTVDADVDADLAWDLGQGHADVVVAIVDSGIDMAHPDLAANIWTNPDEIENGVDDDGNGYIDDIMGWDFLENDNHPIDSHGHGTHVAGIIGAVGDNGTGVVGVNWQVSIMPLRFISAAEYGTTADAIEAIEYADDNGADIINLSWGGPSYSQALKEAIDAADALVVCAAGNNGRELDDTPIYPASYDSANILSVAASDADDHPTAFTNFSDNLADIAAPGTNIFSTVPDRQTRLTDDFATLDNWTSGGDGNAWGTTSIVGDDVLTESPVGNYANNMDTWVRLDPLDLSSRSGSRLDFWIIGTTAGAGDHLLVEGSVDGSAWDSLWIGLDSGATPEITGTIATWQQAIVDLKPYDGHHTLHLRFRFVSDGAGTADGYLIDDVAVTCADNNHGADAYQYYQGTSMAAAFASGAAALIVAQKPMLTPTEIRTLLEATVDTKPQLAGIVATGGRLNLYQALVSVASVDLRSRPASTRSVELEWTVLEPVDSGFEIQRRMLSGSEYETIAIVGVSENVYQDLGLADDTTYIYRVLTLSGGERTGYSNEAMATTPRAVSSRSGGGSGGGGGGGGCFVTAGFDDWNSGAADGLPLQLLMGTLGIFLFVTTIRLQPRRIRSDTVKANPLKKESVPHRRKPGKDRRLLGKPLT